MSDEAQVDVSVDTQPEIAEPETVEQAYDDSTPAQDVGAEESAPDISEPAQQEGQSDVDYAAELANLRREKELAEAEARAYQNAHMNQMSQQQRYDAEAQEREKLLNMTAEERLLYAAEQQERRLNETVADAERRIREANDKASFAALKANEPAAAKLEKEIEKMVDQERQAGRHLDREVAYTYLLGQKARDAARGAGSKKSQQVRQQNVTASQTRATAGAGDQSGERSAAVDDKAARNERLAAGKRSNHYR